jgi:signal transduction histidine kinase
MASSPETLFVLLEKSFPCVLLTDPIGRISHASRAIRMECGPDPSGAGLEGRNVAVVVAPQSAEDLAAAMARAKGGVVAKTTVTCAGPPRRPLELTISYAEGSDGGMFLFFGFFGSRGNGLSATAEWEKDERIKELSCVYSVAEWIEASRSIKEFFEELPGHLGPGMRYPERALVYSAYAGAEYGDKTRLAGFIRTELKVAGQTMGEIRIGYGSREYDLLPEEQKMLDEIGRVLNLALERKSLEAKLALKQTEGGESTERLKQLERQIESRTREVEEQRQKLGTVNAYLDRTKSEWEESKIRLESIFKAIPDTVALIDRQHNLVMTNRPNVAEGNTCYRTFFNRDAPCKDCRLSRVARTKTPITLEIKHEDAYYEVNALPIFNKEHEVEGIIEFYRDITLEKTYEQQLQQADKLASLGQLVSGIGHEINNPNQFIRGNVKIIQQAFEGILPILDEYYAAHPDLKIARLKYAFFREHILVLISDMAHGSERIKEIVEGLKRFARRDEGLLIDAVDVNTIMDASRRLVHNAVNKFADIELDLAPDLPIITGNAQKIEQVVVNLLINAGQAMPEGRRGRIRASTRVEGGYVIIEVQDNGKGMSEQTIKRIFEPFFTTRRANGGTGLGLAIAYRIVEEHGGAIAVTSKLDVGTTFKISLAMKPAGTGGSAKAPVPSA